MRPLRLILVLVVAATTAAQLHTERRRFKVLERLPGRQARDHYEATRARAEHLMLGVTATLAIAAAAALVVVGTMGHAP